MFYKHGLLWQGVGAKGTNIMGWEHIPGGEELRKRILRDFEAARFAAVSASDEVSLTAGFLGVQLKNGCVLLVLSGDFYYESLYRLAQITELVFVGLTASLKDTLTEHSRAPTLVQPVLIQPDDVRLHAGLVARRPSVVLFKNRNGRQILNPELLSMMLDNLADM
ncbi:hypothetical protein KBD61_05060 [Patescibacteria group bacterium]|nr:hypothetical protein [Patescibacteria group bacterium]MBP9710360.1 hypothetical protein [Patescibacteria group bacterium]